jgi:hypothetical protein
MYITLFSLGNLELAHVHHKMAILLFYYFISCHM